MVVVVAFAVVVVVVVLSVVVVDVDVVDVVVVVALVVLLELLAKWARAMPCEGVGVNTNNTEARATAARTICVVTFMFPCVSRKLINQARACLPVYVCVCVCVCVSVSVCAVRRVRG